MANYDSNYAIAQEISARIGVSPIPFDSVYSIALEIYNELGGEPTQFDSVYSILLGILPLVDGGVASKVIDDNVITTVKTWSSSKINSELSGKASTSYVDEQIEAVIGAGNSEIEGKETEDFTFVQSLPVSGEEGQQVIIKGDNSDTLYKYVSGEWVEQTPDATKLYFDVENEALYSYVTAEHQFAPVSLVNTIVVGSNLNSNADLKALKTVGVYNVVQRLHNATKGDYVKNWTLYVESIDYEEYDRSDSVYQRLVSNYTIQKRTWSATRASNDGWSNFSTYYAGEIKDTTTSKYYTWSSNKISSELANIPQLEAGQNIEIADNKINAKGYFYDDEPKEELKAIVYNGQNLNVKITGAAGATTYAETDIYGGAFREMIAGGIFPTNTYYVTQSGLRSKILGASIDGLIFETTLDANNALTEEPLVGYISENEIHSFTEGGIYKHNMEFMGTSFVVNLNGSANSKTYTYSGDNSGVFEQVISTYLTDGNIFEISNDRRARYVSVDTTNKTITFEETLDANNALTEEPILYYVGMNVASGNHSHAEGGYEQALTTKAPEAFNIASGDGSHAEGAGTTASGLASHAEGAGTTAKNQSEHAEGTSNVSHKASDTYGNAGNTQHSIGISEKNAIEVMQNADMYIKGVGGYDGVHIKGQDSGITVQTVQEVVNGLETSVAGKQDTLTAGTNITISGTTISATDTTYVAGEGIEISGNTISCNVEPLQAGDNISVENGRINALGYKFDENNWSFSELYGREVQSLNQVIPISQVGMSDVKVTGLANSTTYTVSGADVAQFLQMMSSMLSVINTIMLSNGKTGVISSIDATNSTITVTETIDAVNALNEVPIAAFLMAIEITLSGAANATTYTYTEPEEILSPTSTKFMIIEGYGEREAIEINTTNHTITFTETLDAENAVTDALIEAFVSYNSLASGEGSHSEGIDTEAKGRGTHAEGQSTLASGSFGAHAEGYYTVANGESSHAEGCNTKTNNTGEHAEGFNNVSHSLNRYQTSHKTISSIGIGDSSTSKNGVEVMWSGDMYLYGVGGYDGVHIKHETGYSNVKTLQEVVNSKADAYETATTADIEAMFS